VRTRYLDRAKEVLVVNLFKAIVSAPFGNERAKFVGRVRTLALTLREVSKAKTALYDEVMPAYIGKKIEHVHSDFLLSICPFLANDSRIWDWLKAADQTRIRRLLESSDVESLKVNAAFDALVIPELSTVVIVRLNSFEPKTQISIINEQPRPEFVKPAIELFSAVHGFREAETRGYSVILPVSKFFSPSDVELLLEVVKENEQIWNASLIPGIIETIFDNTKPLLSATRPYWQSFVDLQVKRMGGNTETYYAYPGLQKRLVEK
jgi:hypothetical protein